MFGFEYANPEYFWILLVLLPMIAWYVFREKDSHADLQYSSLRVFKQMKWGARVWGRHLLFAARVLGIAALVIALARPQTSDSWQTYDSEGIDIMLTLDVSTSMLAQDFKPDRLEAAKEVAVKFILERPQDRIGMVIFSGESFTQSPLTTDHAVLVNVMKDVKCGMIEDGTAIGLGLANAVNRLKDSKSRSRVVILLTDGVNNRGDLPPITAAELAKTYGIRVYTIGVGSMGTAPYPYRDPWTNRMLMQQVPVEIDEEVLNQIAHMTGGRYFRATDNAKLESIYEEIDKLEKSKIEVKHFSKKEENYFWFALIGALLLILEALGRYALLRKIP